MKAYTDINQAKKLAEILPLESADMTYDWAVIDKEYSTIPYCRKPIDDELPCWSLTALLELILPYLGEFSEGIDFRFEKAMNGKWYSAHYIKLDDNGLASFNKTVTGDTAVDAAFEMVC